MESKQLIVKHNRLIFLIITLATTGILLWTAFGPYEKTRIIFEKNFYIAIIILAAFVFANVYGLCGLFNNRPIMILTENGIWTKKTGEVTWENITDISFNITKAEMFDTSSFSFKSSNQEIIKINTSFLEPGNKEIQDFVNKNKFRK